MITSTTVPPSEYLCSTYRPDCEYLNGELRERSVGEWDHSHTQGELLFLLRPLREEYGLLAVPEQRVQVRRERFRVPDICVVQSAPGEQILTRPPVLCIETLSQDDSMTDMQERIEDYLSMGVPRVWIVDPRRQRAYWADRDGLHPAADGLLSHPAPAFTIDCKLAW